MGNRMLYKSKGDLVGSDINVHLQHQANGLNMQMQQQNDAIIKSSSDVRALTYCDLKCIHMLGLVDVLRLYPEYQQEFANDIQHDLTFNLREGYEAEQESDVNGVPSLTLPSISEDDENLHEEGETSPLSPNRSPVHTALTNSPRHAKFSRLQDLHNRPRIGGIATNNLALLRERVERQRSVVIPSMNKAGSLEEINCELRTDVENTRSSVERLDNQISTLHQDVATLSIEVRNAIQALQEMTTPSSGCNSVHYSAHSNPNITRLPHASTSNVMARSSSHPPEMFCWDEPLSPRTIHCITAVADEETQTEIDLIHQYITQNPRKTLQMLGLDPDAVASSFFKTNIKKSHTLPDEKSKFHLCNNNPSSFDNNNSQKDEPLDASVESEHESNTKIKNCPFFWDVPPETSKPAEGDPRIFEAINTNSRFPRSNSDLGT